jgi:glycosidase
LSFYRALIHLRKSMPALRGGMFLPLHHNPKRILAYLRQTKDRPILVRAQLLTPKWQNSGGRRRNLPSLLEVLLSSKKTQPTHL